MTLGADDPRATPPPNGSIRVATGRRSAILSIGLLLLAGGRLLGHVPATPTTIVTVLGIATGAMFLLPALLRRWADAWRPHVLGLFDTAVITAILTLHGPRGLSALFFLAVFPATLDGMVAPWLAVSATLGYLLAVFVHGLIYPSAGGYALTDAFLEAGLLLAVALILVRGARRIFGRLHRTQLVLEQASGGDLRPRVQVAGTDRMGVLEETVNRLIDQLAQAMTEFHRRTQEAGVLADASVRTLERIMGSGASLTGTTAALARDMEQQRELGATEQQDSARAAAAAAALKDSAEDLSSDAHQLVDMAEQGRAHVARTGETLVSIGEEVRTTAAHVHELSELSEKAGTYAQAIGRIARQTRLLALNAAIEAARAGDRGEGFASVAEEVRLLAAQAAGAAREVTDVIAEVRAGIEATAAAVASGEQRVRGVGEVAAQARRALDAIHASAGEAAARVSDVATISRDQAQWMQTLAERLVQTTEISQRSLANVDRVARGVAEQGQGVGALSESSRELLDLVNRLEEVFERWSASVTS